jgi:signal transduction histidine kinase
MFRSRRLTRPQPPRWTVRLRLTLLYGGLFLASGAALLTITYLLVRSSTGTVEKTPRNLPGAVTNPLQATPSISVGRPLGGGQVISIPARVAAVDLAAKQRARAEELKQLLLQSGVALAIMAAASIALGWVVAGRVLRPLRTMTTTTRRISEDNLSERLALTGPDDELKELADTIDGLLARLDAAFQAHRMFVANASHELRTPLAMMRTTLDVATGKPGPQPPQVTALSAKLREGLDRGDRLVESFLSLARAQHGVLQDATVVSIAQIVADAIKAHDDLIAANQIHIQRTVQNIWVEGSATLLGRMVGNLVDNAVRHNRPGGWIRIDARLEGEYAQVAIESAGPQLRDSEVQALTQPFRRLGDQRTGSDNGFGLGLAIVAAITEAHRGKLELHALDEGGLRVLIQLPGATSDPASDGSG